MSESKNIETNNKINDEPKYKNKNLKKVDFSLFIKSIANSSYI